MQTTRRERLERKLEKRRLWSAKAEARSSAALDAAHQIVSSIPLGQPILVGHHSERRHRRAIDRMAAKMDKGCAEAKLAEHHDSKAAWLAAQLDRSIFSDDPDAVEAIEARILELEQKRERMKRVNALYRKGDAAGLAALGLDLEQLRAQVARIGLSFVKTPYESYQLSNLGNNIRRLRERVKTIQVQQERAAAAEAAPSGVTIEGAEWVRVTFAEKPARGVLDDLKAAGYRWGAGCWTGQRERLPASVAAMLEGGAS